MGGALARRAGRYGVGRGRLEAARTGQSPLRVRERIRRPPQGEAGEWARAGVMETAEAEMAMAGKTLGKT